MTTLVGGPDDEDDENAQEAREAINRMAEQWARSPAWQSLRATMDSVTRSADMQKMFDTVARMQEMQRPALTAMAELTAQVRIVASGVVTQATVTDDSGLTDEVVPEMTPAADSPPLITQKDLGVFLAIHSYLLAVLSAHPAEVVRSSAASLAAFFTYLLIQDLRRK
jgi:hypothetical protein